MAVFRLLIIFMFLSTSAFGDTRYIAEIKDNIVQRVIVADNLEWCEKNLGGEWKETFKNDNYNYAGKGYLYVISRDNFCQPQPYVSWELNDECIWVSPIKDTVTDYPRKWDEKNQKWVNT